MVKTTRQFWAVAYRRGGTLSCSWHLTEARAVRNDAERMAQELERQGYKAIVNGLHYWRTIGLPIGWEAGLVDWEQDKIIVAESGSTYWTKVG